MPTEPFLPSSSVTSHVGNRLPNGQWPCVRVTTEFLSAHDTIGEAAEACWATSPEFYWTRERNLDD